MKNPVVRLVYFIDAWFPSVILPIATGPPARQMDYQERNDDMNNALNKKLAEIVGKMDEKVLQTKLNAAMDMLKKGNAEDLVKKINKMDKQELVSKINEFDESKLQELNINKEEINSKVSDTDLQNLSRLIGEHGDEIVQKIKEIIR